VSSQLAFSSWYDYLMPVLPGITTALVDLHLRDIAREYCTQALAWQQPLSPITPQADPDASYYLVPPLARTELVRMLKLTVDGDLYWQSIEPQLDPRSWYVGVRKPAPKYRSDQPPFSISDDGKYVTFTKPVSGVAAIFTAAIRPSIDATTLPDFLLLDQLDAIRCGVLGRLMRMPKKPWTDMGVGAVMNDDYIAWQHRKAGDALRGNQGAMLRTTKTRI
jgi:hypothetical protein